jgi:predicted aldo/keto reductase-like oxidoreductase
VAILGGACFMASTAGEAERPFREAIERGVNHLDIAPGYALAEQAVGPHLPAVRDRLFVACKTGRKNAGGVRAQLEESLRRLRTDHLDLYQLHGVTGLADLETRSAAAEVLLEARERGLVRFVGITGHDLGAPAAHAEALRRWNFDTVMFPIYPRVWADPQYRQDAEALLAECAARDAGAMVIKACASHPWADGEVTHTTWYAPQTDAFAIRRGVRFALSTPGITGFCTPGDLELLDLALDAAEAFTPMSDAERAQAMAEMAGAELIFPLATNARRKPAMEAAIAERAPR